jgi:hypothetical protein
LICVATWTSAQARWSFRWTLLGWVNARVGFEESVELAGDVGDQAAADLAVGPALSPAPPGVGAGGRVVAQPGQDNDVQASISEVGRLLDDGFPLVYIRRRDEFEDRLPQ